MPEGAQDRLLNSMGLLLLGLGRQSLWRALCAFGEHMSAREFRAPMLPTQVDGARRQRQRFDTSWATIAWANATG
eukprot:CAMPEP_0176264510 /NCGR_PEP_ID=MMETSP0121_2-20121125/41666_1 /TAXON_ID=160619 /ORGANISM="Kryptoperidinium foliaceum, Strain CCMP 1326" /LENGTH=74 /DNA_ID=CAMNT_0017604515 /DNA_START=108 /DNA_END=329 /DNA_ORIENTATION=+